MKSRRPNISCKSAVGGLVACAAIATVTAQPADPPPARSHFGAASEQLQARSGKSFGGINIPAQPEAGSISLAAGRCWSWNEGTTSRMLLERDVRIGVGLYQFAAKRAVIWIEPVSVNGQEASQFAAYLDSVSSIPGAAPIDQAAERLLVTGIILTGSPTLKTDRLERSRADDALVAEGEAQLGLYLAEVAGLDALARAAEPVGAPRTVTPPPARSGVPDRLQSAHEPGIEWPPPDDRGDIAPATRAPVEFRDQGVITPFAERIEFVAAGDAEDSGGAIVLSGGIALTYSKLDTAESGGGESLRSVELTAQRAVVFLAPRAEAGLSRYDIGQVQGAYLEGDVVAASSGYTLRGARMYYDFQTERAIVLDAVFWTYDANRGMPLYLRADAIRQESRSQWSAKNVRMANVGFAKPHFAIGASEVTLTAPPADAQTGANPSPIIDASGVKFLAGDLPLVFAPRVKGEFRPTPLKRVSFDSEGGDPIVRTAWDIYALTGLDPAPGNSASLLLDGYFSRGPAFGADIEWQAPDITGSLFSYYIYDNGTDRLPSGDELKHDDDDRGMIQADQVWRLAEKWTLFAEFSYISDETFVPAFFRDEAETHREYVSSLYARYLDEQSLLSLEVRGTLNDFVPNEYLLQSLGYQTQKYPEVEYYRVGDELFGGLIRYSSESRFSMMSLAFTEPTVRELGWRKPRESMAAFGLLPTDTIGDALRDRGLDENGVARFDSRHEFEVPLQAGAVNVIPFAVGRFTAWDTDFEDFSSDSDPENTRFWGSTGLRFGTSLQRVYDSVESTAFDLHRLRHIIEPNGAVWYANTNVEQQDLPVYDDDVESLADGFAARLGVRNTLQTQRGAAWGADGKEEWRTVDWLVVDTNFVFSDDTGPNESPFGRFIDARPEQSILGDFASNDVQLWLTDAVAFTTGLIYSFDDDRVQRTTVGLLFDHGLGFSSFIEYRDVHPLDASFLDLGVKYELTRKYEAALVGVYDTDRTEFQTVGLRLSRRFPQWTVDFGVGVDNISNDASVGVSLRPAGFSGDTRARVLTRDLQGDPILRSALPERERLQFGPFADSPR